MTAVDTSTATKVTTWTIDPSHSEAGFTVRHMMVSRVRGKFTDLSGTIKLDEEQFDRSSVEVEIQTASITTGDEKRDEHLRSADFFDAEKYPTITFKSTKIVPGKGDEFELVGELSMHGVTMPVSIDAEYQGRGMNPWGQEVIGFSGETKINRKDFGLTWNVGLETGGVLVGDEIKISLEVEAIRQ